MVTAKSKFAGSGVGVLLPECRTFCKMVTLYLSWLMVCAVTTDAFNVDKENVITYHGDPQTMFGFSVAEHKEQGRSWVVIGAPETSDTTARYDYRGGAVFYCDTEQNDSCRKIPISSYKRHENHDKYDNNTRQWLGATVRSSGENGVILACAPRYFWFRWNGNSQIARDPVGTCFLSTKNFANFEEYSPCRNKNGYGHGKQGSCQAGFGAAISKDSKRIYIGAVGSYYWQGSAFSQTVYKAPEFMVTKEGPKTADDSWMGYSVASIEYFGEGRSKLAGVVAGVPRGDQMVGKVRLLTWNLTDVRNLTGEQFASYFGYSVAVADIDGDGADDIIVGAPMYSDYNPNKIDMERGRVYVFYQTTRFCDLADKYCWESKFAKFDFIDGIHTKSRFGLSLASLGDINRDGYEDFAVGAPYEGLGNDCGRSAITGAVYIYHGSKNGIRKKYSQVITAKEMSSSLSSLTTFGFSLSGGLDVDNNTYPDLVVGAYESDMVYLFKSRPVIQLEANLSFDSKSKMIGLNDNNCWLKNQAHVSCVPLEFCLKYDGVGVDDRISLDIQVTLDAKQPQSPRMFFVDNEGSNQFKVIIPLLKGGTICKKMDTYIARLRPNQDKLTPLEAELRYSLVEQAYIRRGVLTPVLSMDDDTPLMRRDGLNIKNNCGADNICKPNLNMKISSNAKQYVLGSGDLIFNVSVHNEEEDSFGTAFRMKIPTSVSYVRFEDLTSHKTEMTVQCYPPKRDNMIISCDIGNPLPSNKEVRFSIILEPRTTVEESQFDFWANVTTKNPQISSQMRNQELFITVPILEETQLLINSDSSTSQTLYYNASQYDHDKIETDIQAGPFIRHEYTIKNLGPSDVLEAEVVFDWPSQTSSGDDLLYLFAQPKTEGNIKCERVPNVNYHKLQIRRRFNDRYTEYDKILSQEYTGSSSNSNSKVDQQTNIKWSSGGGSTVNQINNQGSKWTSGSSTGQVAGAGSAHGGTYHYERNQSSHHTSGTFQGSQQGAGSVYQGGQQGGGSTYQQGGSSYQQSGQHGVVVQQGGTGIQQGTYDQQENYHGSSATHYQGGYENSQSHSGKGGQWTTTGGGYQNNNYGGYQGQYGSSGKNVNNVNSVYESESAYHKNTVNNNGNVNTFVEGSWKTNDNGVIKNGSYSSANPGYDYNAHREHGFEHREQGVYTAQGGGNLDNVNVHSAGSNFNSVNTHRDGSSFNDMNAHREGGSFNNVNSHRESGSSFDNVNTHRDSATFFQGQNVPIVTGDRNSQGVDLNTGSRGTIIHRQQIGDDILTTYDEGVVRGPPQVKHRGSETEDVYHNKSVSVKFGKPTELPEHFAVPKSWKLTPQNIPQRRQDQRPPLKEDQGPDDDDEETGDGEEEGDYDDTEETNDDTSPRSKRETTEENASRDFCSMSSCTKIACVIGRLPKGEEVSVIFPAIAWARTIRKIAFNRPVEIGSSVVVNITKLPHIKTPKLNVTYNSEILTNVTSMDYGKTSPDVIPLWIVVTSACLGALILMLLVFLLYKSGFFKRNRPPHLPERQPLNRNGGYHAGDEAL